MDSPIDVEGLTVDRGGRTVLNGVSFSVERGSVTGLLGPSGSGKTTLMRCIVGVQVVRSVTVTVLGQPAGAASRGRSVGCMNLSPSVYDDLSVRENARYFASIYGANHDEAEHAIEDAALSDAAGHLVKTLSGRDGGAR